MRHAFFELTWDVANYLDTEGFDIKSMSFDAKTRRLYIRSELLMFSNDFNAHATHDIYFEQFLLSFCVSSSFTLTFYK